jgi:hypothetical protein
MARTKTANPRITWIPTIRCTQAEKEQIEANAQAAGMTVAAWVRSKALEAAK